MENFKLKSIMINGKKKKNLNKWTQKLNEEIEELKIKHIYIYIIQYKQQRAYGLRK